jgi:hypothetical protein
MISFAVLVQLFQLAYCSCFCNKKQAVQYNRQSYCTEKNHNSIVEPPPLAML